MTKLDQAVAVSTELGWAEARCWIAAALATDAPFIPTNDIRDFLTRGSVQVVA